MKQYRILLLFFLILSGCAPYTPPSDTITLLSIIPSKIDDDFTNQIVIEGAGFLMIDDAYLQMSGGGSRIDPIFISIPGDTRMILSLALRDAPVSTSNQAWNLILVTNSNVILSPVTNIKIEEYYAKTYTTPTDTDRYWWARYIFSDNTSLTLRHTFFQTSVEIRDLYRGDVIRIISLSNTFQGAPSGSLHSYSIYIEEAEENVLNGVTTLNMPSNGQVVWQYQ